LGGGGHSPTPSPQLSIVVPTTAMKPVYRSPFAQPVLSPRCEKSAPNALEIGKYQFRFGCKLFTS
jgi:hypothetical protein